MKLSMLATLRSAERLARERNEELIAQEIRLAIALAEIEGKAETRANTEYETEEEKRLQDSYKKKINEDYWGLCNYTDKGDYYGAMASLERVNYDARFMRSLRAWSIFGMIVAMLLEMGASLIFTSLVTVTAFAASWFFFIGSAAFIIKRNGIMKWYFDAGFIGKLLFNLLYAAVCGGIMYLFLFILN